jgi:hypothetical protein
MGATELDHLKSWEACLIAGVATGPRWSVVEISSLYYYTPIGMILQLTYEKSIDFILSD